MKEKLYTIPLNDAFNENDECVFCNIERKLEQDAIDYVLGSSYMESDTREATDKAGFCRHHFKMMHDYGNSLGNALILKTHTMRLNKELANEIKSFKYASENESQDSDSTNGGLFSKIKSKYSGANNSLVSYLEKKEKTCYVCDYYSDTYDRYMDTFFYLYKTEPDFINKIKNSKGFCVQHLKEVLKAGDRKLKPVEQKNLYPILLELTETNMKRIEEDISWFVDKFDYRYKDADWKNSKDAIPRTMQKLKGGYPADGPYKQKQ